MSSEKIKIACIIPTHNRREQLRQLLRQIQAHENVQGLLIKIIVVVDGSTDGTLEMLNEEFIDVYVVIGDGDWWYTKSINEGFKFAINKFDINYCLTLNDDIVLENRFFYFLSKQIFSDKTENKIYSAVTILPSEQNKFYYSGTIKERLIKKPLTRNKIFSVFDKKLHNGLYPTTRVTGRGLLIPVRILLDLCFFDQKFYQYKSDTDFGLRAIKKGVKTFVNYDTIIYMDIEKTSDDASYKKQTINNFLKSFTNPYSRNYLINIFRFNFRHDGLLFGLIKSIIEILSRFKNHIFIKRYE